MLTYLAQRDNWTLPIEMLSVSPHIFALLGKFLMEVASTVPPTLSFQKHLKQDMEISTF